MEERKEEQKQVDAQPPRQIKKSDVKLNICAVDDQPINIEVLKTQLEQLKYNFEPEYYFRGDLALEGLFNAYNNEVTMFKNARMQVHRRPVDLLLCDFQMPKMNGIEMIQRLRAYISRQNQINEMVKLVEPHIVICSAYLNKSMKTHMTSVGI